MTDEPTTQELAQELYGHFEQIRILLNEVIESADSLPNDAFEKLSNARDMVLGGSMYTAVHSK